MDKKIYVSRIKQFDLIRAIAIGFVVLCHETEVIYQFSIDSMMERGVTDAVIGLSFFTFGRLGVPLFLMLSGYFLLNRLYDEGDCVCFWKDHVLRLFLCTVCWFVLYDIYLTMIREETFSIINIIKDILLLRQVGLGHSWYMPMILGMYILIPFVANALHSMKRSMLILPCIIYIFYILGSVYISRVSQLFLGEPLNVPLSFGFSGGYYGIYFILGYAKGFLKKFSFKVLVTVASCSFFALVMEQYLAMRGVRNFSFGTMIYCC